MWQSLKYRQARLFLKGQGTGKIEGSRGEGRQRFYQPWNPGAVSADNGYEQKASVSAAGKERGGGRHTLHPCESSGYRGDTVVFQGVEGAYSFAAMNTFFGSSVKNYHVAKFRDAMEEIKKGNAEMPFSLLRILPQGLCRISMICSRYMTTLLWESNHTLPACPSGCAGCRTGGYWVRFILIPRD